MLTRRTLPLLTALLLAACGQQTDVTPGPATSVPSGQPVAAMPASPVLATLGHLYEIRFQDVGGQHPTSSAARIPNGAAVGAQALNDVTGSLSFSLVGVDTFLVNGTRHVRAVYRVTNNTGAAIEHLTFVPIDTDDDGDAATTPATAPTVGTTYFKSLLTYGGTDASARAADLTPTTGKTFSAGQGTAITDPEATPYTALDTSPLNPSPPAGLVVAGRSGSGWRSSVPLAAGASANFTFAVDLAGANPQTDPFSFSVVVTEADEVNTAPRIAPAASTSQRLNLPASGPATVSGVLSDPTDPASLNGLDFTVSDTETPAASLNVTVTSSDPSVAAAAVSGSGATRTVKITPQAVGKANVTVSVSDGTFTTSYTVNYASSKASGTPATTRFHTGISNASSATALDGDTMLVADDEFNGLKLYPRGSSGLPLASFDFSGNLNLPDAANPELDLEASTRVGDRLYWLASHSNSKNGKLRPNRDRLFATDLSGTGASSTLSFVGSYDTLRSDLLAWDSGNGHGLGANYLGLTASAAEGVAPEAAGGVGFNIEGLSMAPGSATTALLGFRAPNGPTSARTQALIVPVTNFTSLVTGAKTASFGAPILLDLGGRGVRELKCNDTSCLILAGPASGGSNFALYTWSGKRNDPAQFRSDLTALSTDSGGSLESIVEVPNLDLTTPAADGANIPLLSDNGDTVYYGDGAIAKDVAQNWQKFRSDTVTLGAAQTCIVNSVNVSPGGASVNVGASASFIATVSTTPANCPVVVRWTSSDTGKANVNADSGAATGLAAGTSDIVATASAGYGSAPVSSAPAVLTVNGAADFSLTLGDPAGSTFMGGTGGSITAALTLTPQGGYGGTPSYTVNSSPSGVTGSVTSSTVTLNVPSTLAAGTYSVSVTGTDGTLVRTSNSKILTVMAATAAASNVTVYQVGDGSAALSSAATAVFLKTFSGDSGALVRTVGLPTTVSGSNRPLTASGTASSEGLLSTSADGRYLIVPGYGASVGMAGVASTTSATVPRVIGRVDAAGTVDTTTALGDASTGNNARSAASADGINFYFTGGAGGVRFATLGSTTSVQLSTSPTNLRQAGIFGGQLYASTGSGSTVRLGTVGTGTPTTPGQTISNIPGFPLTGSPYAYFFADLDGTVGVDTLYVADDAAGIQKYVLIGGAWTARGTSGVAADGYRGLTGVVDGGTVNLYATTASKLVGLSDASGFGGPLSAAPTTLVTAPTNTAFRGVAISPR